MLDFVLRFSYYYHCRSKRILFCVIFQVGLLKSEQCRRCCPTKASTRVFIIKILYFNCIYAARVNILRQIFIVYVIKRLFQYLVLYFIYSEFIAKLSQRNVKYFLFLFIALGTLYFILGLNTVLGTYALQDKTITLGKISPEIIGDSMRLDLFHIVMLPMLVFSKHLMLYI